MGQNYLPRRVPRLSCHEPVRRPCYWRDHPISDADPDGAFPPPKRVKADAPAGR